MKVERTASEERLDVASGECGNMFEDVGNFPHFSASVFQDWFHCKNGLRLLYARNRRKQIKLKISEALSVDACFLREDESGSLPALCGSSLNNYDLRDAICVAQKSE